MAIDEVLADIARNIYAITIILAAVGFIARIILKKYQTEIDRKADEDDLKATCKHFEERCDNLEKEIERHERNFDNIVSQTLRPFKDRLYRRNVQKAKRNKVDENA